MTGGSSGIGLATARALAARGASVALAARGAEPLARAAEALRALRPDPARRVAWRAFDVADAEATRSGVEALVAELGGLDLVVNNAGLASARRFVDTPLEEFRRLLEVNALGPVHVTRAALPTLLARGAGHVVNVSSLAGLIAIYGYTAYAPSKFALVGFSEALRQELRPHGIGVSVVFPPDTDTPMLAAENRTKPAETRALAGNAPTLSAEQVAEGLLRGLARGAPWIFVDARSRALAALARLAPRLARAVMDRDIARAQREAAGLSPGSAPS